MQLRPYQAESVEYLAAHRHALLAHEMRLGKTACTIVAAHKLGAQSILVVCPAIATAHWQRQVEAWWPSGPLPRLAVWSYDKARALWQAGLRGNVDVFIPDECHFARNPAAKRTAMVYGKTGFAYRAGSTWALSGTPAPKHAAELWCMMKAFGVVDLSYPDFVRRYCRVDADGAPIGTKVGMIPELRALLARFMLRRTRKEVAPEMPDIAFNFLEMDLGGMDTESRGELDNCMNEAAFMEWAECVADPEDRIAVACAKAEQLAKEIEFAIENGLLKQTVVFGWHKEPLRILAGWLHNAGISFAVLNGETPARQREWIQEQFRAGDIQVVLANILAAGTAIDLSAASHGYFLELWWVGADNMQAANRLVSLDKKEPVTFDVCTAPGTVDERVQQVLVRRTKEIRELGLA